ncbi:MAG: sulfurtransferase [Paracoccaceae bacterium]
MKRFAITLKSTVAALALMAAPAFAADPLVDVAWLKDNLGADNMVVVDARGSTDFLRGHIPGAVNTDYGKDGWRVKVGNVPGVFPEDPTALGQMIGNLGIGDDTHVVVVAPGNDSSDMGTATRIYWTFKVLGHDEVSVLNGGMAAWLKEVDGSNNPVNPLDKGAVEPTPASFTVDLQEDMIPDETEVQAMFDSGALPVDNRTEDQYLGVNKHGAAKAYGTIPGAVNLPQSWLTVDGGGTFRDADTLMKLYAAAGVPTEGPEVNFCNTGHWASIGWFVSSELLGNEEAVMYDPSMVGWTDKGLPVEAAVSLK